MGNTSSTWKSREYRKIEPPPSAVERAILVPYSDGIVPLSGTWVADLGASLLIGGLRGIAPAAYLYFAGVAMQSQAQGGMQGEAVPQIMGNMGESVIQWCGYMAKSIAPGLTKHITSTSLQLSSPSFSQHFLTELGLGSQSSGQTYFFPWMPVPSARTLSALTPLITSAVRVWLLQECLFYIYYRVRVSHINSRTVPEDQPVCSTLRRAHIRRLLDHIMTSGKCPILFIREWFNGAEFKDIRHQNLREWAAGCFFNKKLPECTTQEILEIDDNITFIQRSTGLQAHKGYCSKVGSIRFTMDPVRVLHRPLCMYATLFLSGAIQSKFLFGSLGFTKHEVNGMVYWWRPSTTGNLKARVQEKFWRKYGGTRTLDQDCVTGGGRPFRKDRDAEYREVGFSEQVEQAEREDGLVVVVHGVGVGAWSYLSQIRLLQARFPQKDVLVPELPHVSMQLTDRVPSASSVTKRVEQMMRAHGHARGVFIGHSYGTFVIGHCLKQAPHQVQHAILVDPVCFLIHQQDGPFQFLFSPPSCVFSKLVHFIAQTEPGIVNSQSRNLWWYQSIVWEDHLPSGSSVVLSAQDTIAPSATVRNHLQYSSHRVRLQWMEQLPHAGFQLNPTAMHQTLDCIAPYRMPRNAEPQARSVRAKCNRPCPAADTNLEEGLLTPSLLFSDKPLPTAPPEYTKSCSNTCVSVCCYKDIFNPYCPVKVPKDGVNHSHGNIRDSYWHARIDEQSDDEEPEISVTDFVEDDSLFHVTRQTYQPVIRQYSTLPHLNKATRVKQTTRCGPPPKPLCVTRVPESLSLRLNTTKL